MTKKKNKINVFCECGNDKKWTIYVKGGLDRTGTPKPHTWWFTCDQCEAQFKLGMGWGH
jgi:hypothetical protein